MQVMGRLTQLLSCPIVPAGAAIHPDATLVADHAGPIMLVFTLVFLAVTARREVGRMVPHAVTHRG